jgi:SAM-dependent methyltransferase
VGGEKLKSSVNFQGTPFLTTSRVYATVSYLNHTCEVLLTRNLHTIQNKNILDIASHDGTYSYACLQLGARHVVGVEPRSHMVNDAIENLTSLGHKASEFDFIVDDIFKYLPTVEPGQFDTVLCFGFFYHTAKQTELLAQIRRIKPRYFILATRVEDFKIPESKLQGIKRWECREIAGFMAYYIENPSQDMATIHPTGLTGTPTKSLVEVLLRDYGFKFKQLPWSQMDSVSYLAEIDSHI